MTPFKRQRPCPEHGEGFCLDVLNELKKAFMAGLVAGYRSGIGDNIRENAWLKYLNDEANK